MRILLAEDDAKLRTHLTNTLYQQGISVAAVSTQSELEAATRGNVIFDAFIIDRLLGSFDTKYLLPKLRENHRKTPVLILSAINTPNERTDLIELGADDYMGKPFSTRELLARIRALQRRSSRSSSEYLMIGNTVVDTVRRFVSVNGKTEALPAKEFLLLKTLSEEPGKIWSRIDLLECVWNNCATAATNVVESTVTNLRRKMQHLGSDLKIKNMRNTGYWIED